MSVNYFAYGSNMALGVMTTTCPRHHLLGAASLDDYRLAFTRRSIRTQTGVADVVPAQGSRVWGVLYELEDPELDAIDRKEGCGWAYTRKPVLVRLRDGYTCSALCYTVLHKEQDHVPPSQRYLNQLVDAARTHGLPSDYVDFLASTPTTA
jgi:gamma-glutamylcyclotransferase (GGCT)/AIG2-like uncharacterized protein YtfP